MKNESKPPATFQALKDKCYRSGSVQHKASICKFKNKFCKRGNKIGHISNVCLAIISPGHASKTTREFKSNKINTDIENKNSSTHEIYTVQSSQTVCDKFLIDLTIEEKVINMELYTGAALSSLSYSQFQKLNLKSVLSRQQ